MAFAPVCSENPVHHKPHLVRLWPQGCRHSVRHQLLGRGPSSPSPPAYAARRSGGRHGGTRPRGLGPPAVRPPTFAGHANTRAPQAAMRPAVLRRKWRTGWDSNPRYPFEVYSLSRGAPSAARPPVRGFQSYPAPLHASRWPVPAQPSVSAARFRKVLERLRGAGPGASPSRGRAMFQLTIPSVRRRNSSKLTGNTQWGWPAAA